MPKITFLVGPPCSGKSTWIKNNNTTSVVVSTDDLISWYANKVGKTYDQVFASGLFNSFDKIFTQMIKDYSSEGKDIIVDRTNLTTKGREKLLSLVPENYEKHAVVFNTPLKVLLERNKLRSQETGKTIPEFVIKNMCNGRQEPTTEEFDVIKDAE